MGVGRIETSQRTRADCRKSGFTGIREDNLVKSFEIWIMGNLVREVTEVQRQLNPRAVQEAYEETMGLKPGSATFEVPS